jgi:MATE family multidrug resistance protein
MSINLFMSLTKYEEGSIRELITIAFPLMISSLSVMAMLFVDRLFLANFSVQALNAAVSASTLGWAFIVGAMVLAGMSEVFVAQYNGAKLKDKLGEPVWQMLWFSFVSAMAFIPLAWFGPDLFFSTEHSLHKDYFFWMVVLGWVHAVYSALCGFFIGQGKTLLITLLAIGANFINAFLDWAFIFGIEGLLPSYGVKGAAIATSLSALFQTLILMAVFLNLENRITKGTLHWRFNQVAFMQCIRVGLPCALFVVLEILGWSAYYGLLTWAGDEYITVVGVCQSLIILLWFFTEGVQKAVTAICGNLIGAKKQAIVPKVVFSATVLQVAFFLSCIILLFFFGEAVIFQFAGSMPNYALIKETLSYCFLLMVLYMFFEGVRFTVYGALTAAGDTFFLFLVGIFSIWVFLVLPIYVVVVQWGASVVAAGWICLFYSILSSIIYIYRFLKGKWQEIALTA